MELKDLYKKLQDTSNYTAQTDKKIDESYKDGVQIIAKTIDMVNPYEYSRGLEIEMNMANNAVGDWMEEDLDTNTIKKASKKVLKNLTKDAQYYQKMVGYQMEGDSMYDIEVNKKSIEALKKTNGKIMKEGKTSFLDEQTYTMYADKYDTNEATPDDIAELGRNRDSIYEKYAKRYEVDINELKDRVEARRLEKEEVEGNQDGDDEALSPEELANKYAGSPMREDEKDVDETIEAPDAATALELQKKDPKAYIKIADK
tara:strand:- start:2859 stop:3632 length:774 start_codon:yes stop_codon:yes gene_type:complete